MAKEFAVFLRIRFDTDPPVPKEHLPIRSEIVGNWLRGAIEAWWPFKSAKLVTWEVVQVKEEK